MNTDKIILKLLIKFRGDCSKFDYDCSSCPLSNHEERCTVPYITAKDIDNRGTVNHIEKFKRAVFLYTVEILDGKEAMWIAIEYEKGLKELEQQLQEGIFDARI